MAGRPRKTTIIKDITENGTPEEKSAIESVLKTVDIDKKKVEEPVNDVRKGVVKANPWLNVRNAPFGEIIDKLYPDTEVDIYEVKKGFGKISQSEEKWVSLEFIV